MSEPETRIGTSAAGYRLEALIGRGGMSVVYLAEHVRLGRKVALKVLAPALSSDESFRARFEQESQRAAEIDHPNIIPIYDAGEADGELYIAMRYVRGADLKTMIRRDGPLSVSRALFLLEQAASALDAAHDRDLIHRDVKPANILVEEPSERVYVTDFGVVKHTVSRGQTKTGFFVGTTDYAAPEQIEGRPVDARTDVYALACVLYECLTGSAPYEREADIAVMHAHLTQPPPALSEARPDLPKTLDRVLVRALAKAKEERYGTCTEFIQAARGAVLDQPLRALRDEGTASPAAPTIASVGVEATRAAAALEPTGATPLGDTSPPPVVAGPPDDTPPAASPPPAQPTGAGPPPRSRLGLWLAAGGVAIVAAVAAGLIVFFVTRSDGGSVPAVAAQSTLASTEAATSEAGTETEGGSAGTAATEAATAADTGAVTESAQEAEMAPYIPAEVFKRCDVAATPRSGATETAVCVPSSDQDLRFPDRVEISFYPNDKSLRAAFDAIQSAQGIKTDTGTCSGVRWGGEGAWEHGPGEPGGRRLCYFDGNDAVVVWTHEKLGEADHRGFLGIAREGGGDHARLSGWWRFWAHRIGMPT